MPGTTNTIEPTSERQRAQLRDHVARHRLAQQDERQAEDARVDTPRHARLALTAPQREAAELWAAGYTFREIAARLGVTTNAIKERMFRARWRLGIPAGTPIAEARREVRARL